MGVIMVVFRAVMGKVAFMEVMVVVAFKVVMVKMDLMLAMVVTMMVGMVEDLMSMMDQIQGFMEEAVTNGDLDRMDGQKVDDQIVMMILEVDFMDLMVVEVEEIGIDFCFSIHTEIDKMCLIF